MPVNRTYNISRRTSRIKTPKKTNILGLWGLCLYARVNAQCADSSVIHGSRVSSHHKELSRARCKVP